MARPKTEKHSSDIGEEILRLEQERQRLVQLEDQRRGALIRETLAGLQGDQLRDILRPLISARDAFLFALDSADRDTKQLTESKRRRMPLQAGAAPTREAVEAR